LYGLRVRLIFENKEKGASVPFHHQYYLYRLFKGLVSKCGDDALRNFKNYNFSGLKGQTKVSKSGLHFYSNKITIVFSCENKEFIDSLIQTIFSFEALKVRNLVLKPLSVELEPEITFKEEMNYICISPIILLSPEFSDDSAKEFIHPQSIEFSELLAQRISDGLNGKDLGGDIEFQPDEDYVERIESHGKKYSRVYPLYDQDVPFEVRGYTLPFTLKAPVEVQKHIFNNGLGLFNNKGFGMVDLTNIEPGTETTTYFDGHFVS
jgi:CRISPR-associated endoribonuclease Cas6